ncbi:MAG: ParB/RepB/Spo0J family partition protein [Leptospiraceae bacterium]|nr:ParB/RepB/Spo0J family partition protein [Leptospiraceae bacterium]
MKSLRKVGESFSSATSHNQDFQEVLLVPIEDIDLDVSKNIRDSYDLEGLKELAKSIETHGLLEPIGIEKNLGKNGKYPLVFGFRRALAISKFTNIKIVRAITVLSSSNKEIIQLLENIQREDLSDYELAKSLYQIKKASSFTIEELARNIDKSIDWVKKKMVHANILNDIEDISSPNQLNTLKNLTTQQIASISKLAKNEKIHAIEEIGKGKSKVKDIRNLSYKFKKEKVNSSKKRYDHFDSKTRIKELKMQLKSLYSQRTKLNNEIAKYELELSSYSS